MPNASIVLTGEPEVRDTDLRFTWDYLDAGTTVFSGIDYVQLAPSGQIAAIHGFWDPFTDGNAVDAVTAWVEAWNADDEAARAAALADAVADGARFVGAQQAVEGSDAIAVAIGAAYDDGLTTVSSVALQRYGTPLSHARVQLTLDGIGGGAATVTDYLRFDAEGLIEQVGRFVEP